MLLIKKKVKQILLYFYLMHFQMYFSNMGEMTKLQGPFTAIPASSGNFTESLDDYLSKNPFHCINFLLGYIYLMKNWKVKSLLFLTYTWLYKNLAAMFPLACRKNLIEIFVCCFEQSPTQERIINLQIEF